MSQSILETEEKKRIEVNNMIVNALIVTLSYLIQVWVDRLTNLKICERPIVGAVITGVLLGDPVTGIIMGGSLEAIFMGISAIGGSVPSDAGVSAVIVTAFSILTGADMESAAALAMPIGTVIATLGQLWKPVIAAFVPYWEKLAATGNMRKFRIQVVGCGLVLDRLPHAIAIFLGVAFGIEGLANLLDMLPAFFTTGLSAASGIMTAVGFAILCKVIWNAETAGFFFVGFILAKIVGMDTLSIAIVLAVVAVMYFYNDLKISKTRVEAVSNGDEKTKNEMEDFF
ncbi:MAG: PTS sugar transporter subunit IIC [Lachnospiraceae bacterium]|nr:PTS sugar transporter subunit IIC [Lachnospiraceae bacterium]